MFLHYGLVETYSFFILVLLGVLHFIKNNKSNSPPLQIFHSCKMFSDTVVSPNTAPLLTLDRLPPNTAADFQVPNKFFIGYI